MSVPSGFGHQRTEMSSGPVYGTGRSSVDDPDADATVPLRAADLAALCDLTSRAPATGLGVNPERFPGGHVGFVEDPPAFEARLREVLSQAWPAEP